MILGTTVSGRVPVVLGRTGKLGAHSSTNCTLLRKETTTKKGVSFPRPSMQSEAKATSNVVEAKQKRLRRDEKRYRRERVILMYGRGRWRLMGSVVICGSEVVDIPVFTHEYDLLAACQVRHGYQSRAVDLHRRGGSGKRPSWGISISANKQHGPRLPTTAGKTPQSIGSQTTIYPRLSTQITSTTAKQRHLSPGPDRFSYGYPEAEAKPTFLR